MSAHSTDEVPSDRPLILSPLPEEEIDTSPLRSRAPRVWFVDILRLIASFQMVNGHTLDAVMVMSIRQGGFYDGYIWARGLVSVAFLFVAGIAFHLSTLARFEKHKGNPKAVRRRFRRAGIIILVGYLLHFPFGAFNSDPDLQRMAWFYFRQVDVLHCIGLSLLMLELMTLACKKPPYVIWGSVVAALACFALAPLADQAIGDGRPHFLLNWLSHHGGSQFPLFPWSGFVFAGLVAGAYVMPDAGRTPFSTVLRRLLFLTGLATLGWQLADHAPFGFFDAAAGHHPSTSGADSFEKLAAILALITVLAVLSRPIRELPSLLKVLSSETLAIFSIHIIILFYPLISVARKFDHRLELPQALMVSLGMLLATGLSTWCWHHIKRRWAARSAG